MQIFVEHGGKFEKWVVPKLARRDRRPFSFLSSNIDFSELKLNTAIMHISLNQFLNASKSPNDGRFLKLRCPLRTPTSRRNKHCNHHLILFKHLQIQIQFVAFNYQDQYSFNLSINQHHEVLSFYHHSRRVFTDRLWSATRCAAPTIESRCKGG